MSCLRCCFTRCSSTLPTLFFFRASATAAAAAGRPCGALDALRTQESQFSQHFSTGFFHAPLDAMQRVSPGSIGFAACRFKRRFGQRFRFTFVSGGGLGCLDKSVKRKAQSGWTENTFFAAASTLPLSGLSIEGGKVAMGFCDIGTFGCRGTCSPTFASSSSS